MKTLSMIRSILRRREPPSIVVLDDDEALVSILTRILEEHGLHVCGFHKAREALDFVFREPPDLLMVDQEMPEIQGIDVISKVRCLGFSGKIILLSGYDPPDWVPTGVRFLDKGFCSIQPVLNAIEAELKVDISDYGTIKRTRHSGPTPGVPGLASRI